jgi:cardiolipin synthase C
MEREQTRSSRIGRWIDPQVGAHQGRSGFRLLATGVDAFVARAVLIELADRTLDLQYYIFHRDTTGSIVIDRLIAAADRGVRIRLLLDDWGTLEKKDEVVAGLDGHPNIAIRLFNPYVHRSGLGKLGELVTRFARVNRRMHNKQLIADGAAVVLGGRNIGDEYFGAGELEFQDVDVLGVGPVVGEAGASFEAYWSSEFAKPITALGRFTVDPAVFEVKRRELRERVTGLMDSPYARALAQSDLAGDLRAQTVRLHWAEAAMFADPPGKVSEAVGTRSPGYLGARIAAAAQAAQSELLIVSPYFVPGRAGVASIGARGRDGLTVRILTNSLAATDVWLVHAGYRKYRRPLLEQGVRLYELKPSVGGPPRPKGTAGSSRASLHGKTFVFDRSSVFIGSVNLDPRSLEQNTEDGVLVRSNELAREVATLFEQWAAPAVAYEVRPAGGMTGAPLEWIGSSDGQVVRFRHEPEAGFWRRLGAAVFSRLPIDRLI